MHVSDPFLVLGLTAGATLEDAAEAYKRLAKEWHPDVMGVEGLARMTELNVAYELLRAEHRPGRNGASVGPRAKVTAVPDDPRGHARHGAWLPEAIRRALGPELLSALEPDEHIELVTPAATWASPSTLLAVTDRRLCGCSTTRSQTACASCATATSSTPSRARCGHAARAPGCASSRAMGAGAGRSPTCAPPPRWRSPGSFATARGR